MFDKLGIQRIFVIEPKKICSSLAPTMIVFLLIVTYLLHYLRQINIFVLQIKDGCAEEFLGELLIGVSLPL